jgi:hypothetical protein
MGQLVFVHMLLTQSHDLGPLSVMAFQELGSFAARVQTPT